VTGINPRLKELLSTFVTSFCNIADGSRIYFEEALCHHEK